MEIKFQKFSLSYNAHELHGDAMNAIKALSRLQWRPRLRQDLGS